MFRTHLKAAVCTSNPFLSISRRTYYFAPNNPYSGPSGYETITKRFSKSMVDPVAFFKKKREKEAKGRGELADVHHIGSTDPKEYDVLITDINHKTLDTEIAEHIGLPYLSKATEADTHEIVESATGYLYGANLRPIIPLVVRNNDQAHWVFFLLDSLAPSTYISYQVSRLTYLVFKNFSFF